jgi:hypothetical protein
MKKGEGQNAPPPGLAPSGHHAEDYHAAYGDVQDHEQRIEHILSLHGFSLRCFEALRP